MYCFRVNVLRQIYVKHDIHLCISAVEVSNPFNKGNHYTKILCIKSTAYYKKLACLALTNTLGKVRSKYLL